MPYLKPRDVVLHHRFRPGAAGHRAVVFANSLGTDLRIWDAVIDRLPPEMPVLAFDKRGHGLTGAGPVSLAHLANDVTDLMDAHGIESAVICGVSVGGMIAQALASGHPDRVAGLILCMTAHRLGDADSWTQRIAAVERDGLGAIADGIMERWFSDSFRAAHPVEVEGYRTMLARTTMEGYRDHCAMLRDTDLTEIARALRVPTLCLAGGADRAAPVQRVRDCAALIEGADFRCLDGVGHIPSIEAPDLMARIVTEFCAGLA